MATKDQQRAEIVEGLGLGLLSLGYGSVTASKIDLEFAFSHAFRRWEHADAYPSIGRAPKPDNEFWIGVTKSERRKSAGVVWRLRGSEYVVEIPLGGDDWTPEEVAEIYSDRPLGDWKAFAALFVEWFTEREKRRQ